MKRAGYRTEKGFTLVELIAATAIATTLMAAVLQLVMTLATASRELETADTVEVWHRQVYELLMTDFANSQMVTLQNNGFRLQGNAGRARRDGPISHRPSVVEYSIQQRGRFAVLNRTIYLRPSGQQQDSQEIIVGANSVHVYWRDIEKLPFRFNTPQVIPPIVQVTIGRVTIGRVTIGRVTIGNAAIGSAASDAEPLQFDLRI